jgi:hypothetical protein
VAEAVLSDDRQYIRVLAKSSGSTLLHVSLKGSSHVYDVIDLEVGSMLFPASPVYLHLGGAAQFEATKKSARGEWVVDDPAVLRVDSAGLAQAMAKGTTYLELRDSMTYRAKVHVWQADTIEIVKGPTGILSNVRGSTGYLQTHQFEFKVYDSHSLRKVSHFTAQGSIDNGLLFKCEVEEVGAFEAEARLEKRGAEEIPACIVTPRERGTKTKKLTLVASVLAKDGSFRLSKRF